MNQNKTETTEDIALAKLERQAEADEARDAMTDAERAEAISKAREEHLLGRIVEPKLPGEYVPKTGEDVVYFQPRRPGMPGVPRPRAARVLRAIGEEGYELEVENPSAPSTKKNRNKFTVAVAAVPTRAKEEGCWMPIRTPAQN